MFQDNAKDINIHYAFRQNQSTSSTVDTHSYSIDILTDTFVGISVDMFIDIYIDNYIDNLIDNCIDLSTKLNHVLFIDMSIDI